MSAFFNYFTIVSYCALIKGFGAIEKITSNQSKLHSTFLFIGDTAIQVLVGHASTYQFYIVSLSFYTYSIATLYA